MADERAKGPPRIADSGFVARTAKSPFASVEQIITIASIDKIIGRRRETPKERIS